MTASSSQGPDTSAGAAAGSGRAGSRMARSPGMASRVVVYRRVTGAPGAWRRTVAARSRPWVRAMAAASCRRGPLASATPCRRRAAETCRLSRCVACSDCGPAARCAMSACRHVASVAGFGHGRTTGSTVRAPIWSVFSVAGKRTRQPGGASKASKCPAAIREASDALAPVRPMRASARARRGLPPAIACSAAAAAACAPWRGRPWGSGRRSHVWPIMERRLRISAVDGGWGSSPAKAHAQHRIVEPRSPGRPPILWRMKCVSCVPHAPARSSWTRWVARKVSNSAARAR